MKKLIYYLAALFCISSAIPSYAESTNTPFTDEIRKNITAHLNQDNTLLTADLRSLLQNYEKQYGVASPQYAEAVLWCAMVCEQAGDCKQSQRLIKESERLYKQYGSGPFNGRDTISEIFRLDVTSAIEEKAERTYNQLRYAEKALKLKREKFGPYSEVYLKAALDLSKDYAVNRSQGKSIRLHNEAFQAYTKLIKDNFRSMTDHERENYWNVAIKYIEKTLENAHTQAGKFNINGNGEIAGAAYDAVLLSKGLLLNLSMGFEHYLESIDDADIKNLLAQKKEADSDLKADSIDRTIIHTLDEKGLTYDIPQMSIAWQDVRDALGDDDLAVEYYKTPLNEYGAILLRKNWSHPILVNLPDKVKVNGKSHTLENALGIYASQIKNNPDPTDDAWQLSKVVWTDQIIRHFPATPSGKVFFSTDGVMQMTGIEYLPISRYNSGIYPTLFDLYNLNRLSSTRVLALQKEKYSEIETAKLFGGLAYNMSDSDMLSEHNNYPNASRGDFDFFFENSDEDDSQREIGGSQKKNQIPPLAYTRNEVEEIADIITGRHLDSKKYVDKQGVEEAFKAMSGDSPEILHVATHGFYIPPTNQSQIPSWLADANNGNVADDPLKRTGLLMAGAHKAYIERTREKGIDDGILSAYEISRLDLSNLNLAVLSACQTGLGDIVTDGISGLQRGFKKAGTNSLIVSLWKVDDEATYRLMTNFYRYWISEGLSKTQALQKAQESLRTDAAHPQWKHPRYWSAFILIDGN